MFLLKEHQHWRGPTAERPPAAAPVLEFDEEFFIHFDAVRMPLESRHV